MHRGPKATRGRDNILGCSPENGSARLGPETTGFTRVEALALAAALSLLSLLGLPTLGGLRAGADQQMCRANFAHLTRAWILYAEDNQGRLAGNLDGGEVMSAESTNRNWASGWLDFSGGSANTNEALLRNAQLGRYLEDVSVYRCPADLSLSRGSTGKPRVRSVAMNGYVGQRVAGWTLGFRIFTNLSSIVDPSPSGCLVFIDEHEDSVNDPCFFISMDGFDPAQSSQLSMVDFPASRHDGGASTSFADGHVESWRWRDARTRPALRPNQRLSLLVSQPNNRDIRRLQEAASRRTTSLP